MEESSFHAGPVGDEFAALVLNPAKYGLFVELTDLFVEGLVPIDTLRGDRYTWRENTHEIVGERTGRRFRAGDRVQVILDRILAQERKLQFALVEEGFPSPAASPRGPHPNKEAGQEASPARQKATPEPRSPLEHFAFWYRVDRLLGSRLPIAGRIGSAVIDE